MAQMFRIINCPALTTSRRHCPIDQSSRRPSERPGEAGAVRWDPRRRNPAATRVAASVAAWHELAEATKDGSLEMVKAAQPSDHSLGRAREFRDFLYCFFAARPREGNRGEVPGHGSPEGKLG